MTLKFDYHITNLQPFDFDSTKVNRREVANADQGVVDIVKNICPYIQFQVSKKTWVT